MRIIDRKAILAKTITIGLLAGVFVIASPSKAQAQVSVGIQLGDPIYARPVYRAPAYRYVPGYYASNGYDGYNGYDGNGYDRQAWERHAAHERHEARERYEAQRRHEEHERREAWERDQRSWGDGWNRRNERDGPRYEDR